MPCRACIPVDERVNVIDTDRQDVCLGDCELDKLGVIVWRKSLTTPVPVLARADYGGEDGVDFDGGSLAIEDHLGAIPTGVGRKGRLEPSPVDRCGEMEVDGAGRLGGRQGLQPTQHVLTAVLDLLRCG